MSVTGYLALYTTLLGWQQYQNLWNIAVGTGLIYLPFISIVLTTTLGPFTSMGAKDAAQIAVRRLIIQILIAFFVILFAAEPLIPLEPNVLHFEPRCSESGKSVTPGHTGTTYDNTFPVPTGVKVPMLWYFVMALANGVTHAASQGLTCSPLPYRELHTQLNTAQIQDPALRQETAQFYRNCYVPAYATYLSGQLTPTQHAQVEASLTQNGKEDIGWLGSHTFLSITGFYDAHKAPQPISDFAFDPQRDQEESQVPNHSLWGNPDCKSWWTDPQHGLAKRLKQTLPPSFWQQLLHSGGDPQQLQDATLKTLIHQDATHQQPVSALARGYESLNDNGTGDYLSRFIGAPLGILQESLSFFPKLHLLINALPVIQGALLFAIYAFLGLAIPFSRYRIAFCVTGAIVLFSLIFCSFLWNLTAWFDDYLIQALYPKVGNVAGFGGVLNDVSASSVNELFVDMIIGTLYVILPLLWMGVMSWAGYHAGLYAMGFINTLSAPASHAGDKAGGYIGRSLF